MGYHDIATRAQVVALRAYGVSNQDIEAITGVKRSTISTIFQKALDRGFDPQAERPIIYDKYVNDAPKSGRPNKQDGAKEEVLSRV